MGQGTWAPRHAMAAVLVFVLSRKYVKVSLRCQTYPIPVCICRGNANTISVFTPETSPGNQQARVTNSRPEAQHLLHANALRQIPEFALATSECKFEAAMEHFPTHARSKCRTTNFPLVPFEMCPSRQLPWANGHPICELLDAMSRQIWDLVGNLSWALAQCPGS